MAVGALKAAKAYGLRVPEDISIIGIDNSIVAYACEPRLQTVHFQMDKLGRIAAEILLECINNPQSKAERIIVPHIMIPGESVGKVNE
jgi:DNA-binding LacI/PurR family transcriptional regulator